MAGGIPITIPFELLNASPLDKRFYSNNATERNNIAFRYRGMIHYTKGEGLYYVDDNFAFQPMSEVLKESQALKDWVEAQVNKFFIDNPAVIEQAITNYFSENPVQVTPELIAEAVENYFSENPVASPTAIGQAVNEYLTENPVTGGALPPKYTLKELPITLNQTDISFEFPWSNPELVHTGSVVTEIFRFTPNVKVRIGVNNPNYLNGPGGQYPHPDYLEYLPGNGPVDFLMYLSNDAITEVHLYAEYQREPGNWQYLADLTFTWPEDKNDTTERTMSILYYDLDGNPVMPVDETTLKFDFGQEFNLTQAQLDSYPYQFAIVTGDTLDGETLDNPNQRKRALYRANNDLVLLASPWRVRIIFNEGIETNLEYITAANVNFFSYKVVGDPNPDNTFIGQLMGFFQEGTQHPWSVVSQDEYSTIVHIQDHFHITGFELYHWDVSYTSKWDVETGNQLIAEQGNIYVDAEYFIPGARVKDELRPHLVNFAPPYLRNLYPQEWDMIANELFTVETGNPYVIEDLQEVDRKLNFTFIDLFNRKKIEVIEAPTSQQAQDTGLKAIAYPSGGDLPDHSGQTSIFETLVEYTKPFAAISFDAEDGSQSLGVYDFYQDNSLYPSIIEYFIDKGKLQFDITIPDRYFFFPAYSPPVNTQGVFIALIKNY
jgi:hypothetical protein